MRVLVVSTQFPLPPSSGFGTRVHQITRQIASRHDVTFLSFVEPGQEAHVRRLREEFPVEVVERKRASTAHKRRVQVLSLASIRPFHCRMLYSTEMQGAIDQLHAAHRFDVIQIESSVLGTFRFPRDCILIIDEHNVEYEVFKRIGQGERAALRRVFNMFEYRRFRRFEQGWWRSAEGCVVTSHREKDIIIEKAPRAQVAVVPNGVDLQFFAPSAERPDPQTVVFNGLLHYRPNLDAARHLIEDVWPLVIRDRPHARLTIVGGGNEADLRQLRRATVSVTGRVDDVRPYLAKAAVVVVPVRMGGGTRLKVVEALAMGKAVVSTTLGCEGVHVRDREHLWIADDAPSFAAAISHLFRDVAAAQRLGVSGRARMVSEYSWDLAGERLEDLYRVVSTRATTSSLPPLRGS